MNSLKKSIVHDYIAYFIPRRYFNRDGLPDTNEHIAK